MTDFMKLENIGEFGLIEKIAKGTKTDRSVIKGIGDDAAVLEWTKDKYLLATADMLIEGRHFKRGASPEKIGWKALCCGVSDIAAMGGEPRWAVVSCGLPKGLAVQYADRIYSGLKKAAGRFGVNIVGGDTNASDKIILDVTVLGEVKKEDLVLRSGARTGDFIFVTGELGGSIRGKHLDFTPRLKESRILVKNFKINSMIDLSDGLSSDLNHILEQSGVGAIVYDYLIPISPHLNPLPSGERKYRDISSPSPRRGEGRGEGESIHHALSDGEDFELLFTMSKKEGFKLLKAREKLFDIPVTRIGTITGKKFGVKIVDIFGRKRELTPRGFKHF